MISGDKASNVVSLDETVLFVSFSFENEVEIDRAIIFKMFIWTVRYLTSITPQFLDWVDG